MIVSKKYAQKKLKDRLSVKCFICGEVIRSGDDPETYEYAKTKSGKDIFFHTGCIKRW